MLNTFKQLQKDTLLKQINIICFVTACLYLIIGLNDIFFAPPEFRTVMLSVHLIIMPFILFSLSALAYFKKYLSGMSILLFSAPIIAAFLNIYIVSHYHIHTIYSSEIYLILFWIFAVSGMPFKHMLGSSVIIILVSIFSTIEFYSSGGTEFTSHIIWMLSSFTLGFIGAILFNYSQKNLLTQYEKQSLDLSNKNILLKELFHRVKNNLQIISGILYMQSKKIDDEEAKQVFKNSIQTIKSMGMVHEKLYKSNDLASIDFNEYINDLLNYINQDLEGNNITFDVKCEDIAVSLDQAVPLGLITNEILTNSIKHAFTNTSKRKLISIKLFLDENKKINLLISDNGRGIDFENFEKNFGYTLIYSLATQQLKGSCECFNDNGLSYVIRIDPNAV